MEEIDDLVAGPGAGCADDESDGIVVDDDCVFADGGLDEPKRRELT